MDSIKQLFQNGNLNDVYFTRLALRFNLDECDFSNLNFYQMETNVTKAKPEDVFIDCGNGTKYIGPVRTPYYGVTELEIDLGTDAVLDFQKAFDSSDKNGFFALGMVCFDYSFTYAYGPRLVLEWSDSRPVHNIDKDLYYPTIQMAVNDADIEDTIEVDNSILFENIIIDKPLELTGKDKHAAIIDGSGSEDVIQILADNVRISNFTINNSRMSNDYAGIKLPGVSDCSIENNIFTNHQNSILLDSSTNINIKSNEMVSSSIIVKGYKLDHWNTHNIYTDNTVNGKPVHYWKNTAGGIIPSNAGQIIIANSSNITIENQKLTDGSTGLLIGYSHNNLITNIYSCSNNGDGLYLQDSDQNMISKSNSSNNLLNGINLFNSDNNIIVDSICSNNNGNGINLKSSANNLISNSVSVNNNVGILIEGGIGNNIEENICSKNIDSGIKNLYYPDINFKKEPLDIIISIDTSGSMRGKKISDLKVAAINFINHEYITDQDRIAIFHFDNSIPELLQPYTICDSSGKEALTDRIYNLAPYSSTPLWIQAAELTVRGATITAAKRCPAILMGFPATIITARYHILPN
jgi:parallel beta-helix repeat protein